jgi:hypothetical protein
LFAVVEAAIELFANFARETSDLAVADHGGIGSRFTVLSSGLGVGGVGDATRFNIRRLLDSQVDSMKKFRRTSRVIVNPQLRIVKQVRHVEGRTEEVNQSSHGAITRINTRGKRRTILASGEFVDEFTFERRTKERLKYRKRLNFDQTFDYNSEEKNLH